MCVSLDQAQFQGTIISLSEALHPLTGKRIMVLTYTNTVENQSRKGGANAMLLHFPSSKMTRDNLVDTKPFRRFSEDLVDAVRPQRRSFGGEMKGTLGMTRGMVDVFDHDIYSVVVADCASDIPSALGRVAAEKRPELNQRVFDWYQERFTDYTFWLCCFNNRDAQQAAPLMWWYEPLDETRIMLPGLDAHTGAPPDLREQVEVDHWLILGSKERRSHKMTQVSYTKAGHIPANARALLPDFVTGIKVDGYKANGDFIGGANLIGESPGHLYRGLLTA